MHTVAHLRLTTLKNNLSKLNSLAYLSFDYHRLKSRSDIDVLIEVYKLLDKSLNKKVKT